MYQKTLNGYGLFGSTGKFTIRQPSSFVGKSTIASMLREEGFITCSFADEIRLAATGNEFYGDLMRRNNEPRPVEPPETKQLLIQVGEGFNATEPYGWAILAALKMILLDTAMEGEQGHRTFISKHNGFVVDDVRCPNELLLLNYLGIQPVEVVRIDGEALQYDCDGRLGFLGAHTLINDGEPETLQHIVEHLSGWKGDMYRCRVNVVQREHLNGVLRMFAHMLSPDAYKAFWNLGFVSEYFSEQLEEFHDDEALELRNQVIERMISTLRNKARNFRLGLT